MPNLVLDMRQGDMMIVNGAAIRFRGRCTVELTAQARFLFGRQIMPPDQARTPARRIYAALQAAYIGEPEERRAALDQARLRIAEFRAATTSRMARALLDEALRHAEADQGYQSLRLARRIIQHEDAILGRPRAT